jgi:hypothetical protein
MGVYCGGMGAGVTAVEVRRLDISQALRFIVAAVTSSLCPTRCSPFPIYSPPLDLNPLVPASVPSLFSVGCQGSLTLLEEPLHNELYFRPIGIEPRCFYVKSAPAL